MKIYAVFLCAIALFIGFTQNSRASAKEAIPACNAYATLAGDVMRDWQNRVDGVTMLNREGDEEIISNLYLDVSETPMYSTSKFQANAVADFKNKKFSECLREYVLSTGEK